jgi:hypothetical protein
MTCLSSFSGWVSLQGGPLDGCEFYLPDDFADLTVLVIQGHRYRLMMETWKMEYLSKGAL